MKLRKFHSLLILAALAVGLASCSQEKSLKEKKKEPDSEIRQEGEKTIITRLDTGEELVFGATDEKPEGFPEDLPVWPGASLNNYFVLQGTLCATFFTEEEVQEVKKFFLEEGPLADSTWQVTRKQEKMRSLSLEILKGDRRAEITLTDSQNPKGTLITYTTLVE